MKLSEYTEEDLLKAFRRESYALGELNHLKSWAMNCELDIDGNTLLLCVKNLI